MADALADDRDAKPAGKIMIEVNERIEVAAAPRQVWDVLADPNAVVECVSGATLGERHEDGSFDATLLVQFGPAKVNFQANVLLQLDAATKTGTVNSKGKDKIGGTRVTALMKFGVEALPGATGSAIPVKAEVEISGRLASLIETGASIVVKRMVADFTKRLAAKVGAAPTASDQ